MFIYASYTYTYNNKQSESQLVLISFKLLAVYEYGYLRLREPWATCDILLHNASRKEAHNWGYIFSHRSALFVNLFIIPRRPSRGVEGIIQSCPF